MLKYTSRDDDGTESCYRYEYDEFGNQILAEALVDGEWEMVSAEKYNAEGKIVSKERELFSVEYIFDENGTSYYVMKYLGGGSLAAKLAGGPFPEKTALRIVGEVADALSSIHANGLLHLDIKPANILMDERGRSVLIDFGVSKYVDSNQDSSTTSSLIGFSRGFAPLEQYFTRGKQGPWTDVYALAATLYFCITGAVPVDSVERSDEDTIKRPSELGASIPAYAVCN